MYNRYVRNDAGRYERIPTPDPPRDDPPPFADDQEDSREDWGGGVPPREEHTPPPPPRGQAQKGILSSLLKKLNLENIDTGDLLLLVLLFLLFKDGEDEELLIALGLLLIL